MRNFTTTNQFREVLYWYWVYLQHGQATKERKEAYQKVIKEVAHQMLSNCYY